MNVKRHLLLIFSMIILITFLPETTLAASKMPNGTKVANLFIENKTDAEVQTMIGDEIIIWQAQEDIVLEGEFETLSVSRDAFSFNPDATFTELENKTKRSLSTFFKRPQNVYIPLTVDINEEHEDIQYLITQTYINDEAVLDNLRNLAANLEEGTIALSYLDDEEIPLETVAEVSLDVPKLSTAALDYIVNELNGQLIAPEQLFSFLDAIDTPEKLLNSRDESSFLGTGLYTLFLQADFEIVSRYPQLTMPSYGEKGLNAEVNKRDNKDLIVMNTSDSSYRIKIETSRKQMVFTLEGKKPTFTYEIEVNNEKKIKPRTIYRYSKKISPGTHEVVQAGKDGLTIDVVRSAYENGSYISESVVSKDLYLPTPTILLVSPDEIEESNVEDNPDSWEDLFEEEMVIDRQGNIIRPDGSKGDSILDLLPGDLEESDMFDQITEVDEAQKRYEEFLDNLLKIYETSFDEVDQNDLEQIKVLEKRIKQLEKDIEALFEKLAEQDLIDESVIKKIKGGEGK